MGEHVEHITDLGLVNYVQHPTNSKYIVFRFADKDRAADFEKALKLNDIWFEKGEQQGRTRLFYMYGVHRRDFKKVQSLNFAIEGKHRTFIIKNNFFRWFLILFSVGITVLAFVGYCKRPDIVKKQNTQELPSILNSL